ncbi:phosphoglycerate mutase protein, putative, partial [Trypanosoma cruzi marinkellei]
LFLILLHIPHVSQKKGGVHKRGIVGFLFFFLFFFFFWFLFYFILLLNFNFFLRSFQWKGAFAVTFQLWFMSVVHICRHGQDEDNFEGLLNGRRDRPLTQLGREQASTLAQKLKERGMTYDIILTSPLKRANETARIIGEALSVHVETENELVEREFGVLTGKPIAQIRAYAGENVVQGDKVLYFLSVDGAETFDECYDRAARVLHRVDTTFAGKRVLLVCHGDIGKMLLAVKKKITWREGIMLPYFDNTSVLET